MIRAFIIPIIIVVLSVVTFLLVINNIQTPIRPVLAFFFVFLAPGLAFVQMMRIKSLSVLVMLSIALSLSINSIVTTVLATLKSESTPIALTIVVCITIAGAVMHTGIEYVRYNAAQQNPSSDLSSSAGE